MAQSDWRWCKKCQGLFFAANNTLGVCPAGGAHSEAGSDNYVLETSGSGQSDWNWCSKCQGLFFAGNKTAGVCPAGGGHNGAASSNYVLPSSGSGQSNWRWCSKCQGLFFAGNKTAGVCPAGGGHDDATSCDYVLADAGSRPSIDYTVVLMLWGPPQPPGQTTWPSTLTGPVSECRAHQDSCRRLLRYAVSVPGEVGHDLGYPYRINHAGVAEGGQNIYHTFHHERRRRRY